MSDFLYGVMAGLLLIGLLMVMKDEISILVKKEVAAGLAAQGETA